jgi:hypothetical protein
MNTLDLEVFRAGDYGERGVWQEAALDQLARDYDPTLHEAPVTVDHAQSGPALGWVESLRRLGGVLVARLRDLDPGFADLIRRGAYKKRSVEIYPALRETGRPYLRAVSFLGACPPAVKGLADVVFAEGTGEPLRVAFAPADEAEERGEPPWEALQQRLMAAGRWLPSWEEMGLRAFWSELTGGDQREWFERFLDSLPPAVPTRALGDLPTGSFADEDSLPASTPRAEVSATSVALHRRAVAFRETHPGVSYAEALRAATRCA